MSNDEAGPDRSGLFALLAGAATLVVELALIRYVPGEIRVLGYFTNFVLLAAFLGFGVGMLAHGRVVAAQKWPLFAPLGPLAIAALARVGASLEVLPSASDFLFLEYQRPGAKVSLYVFLALAWALIAASLVPLGAFTAVTLAGDRPLRRYAFNIAGSLLGIALFAVVQAFALPPWTWMAIAGALASVATVRAAPESRSPRAWMAVALSVPVLLAAFAWPASRNTIWSPYQKLSTAPIWVHPDRGVMQDWKLQTLSAADRARARQLPLSQGFVVRVNDDSYQHPLDLSDNAVAREPALRAMRRQYDVPFMFGRPVRSVLVLGAGTGNDVAAALRAGAQHVDAVEIDPEILRLGRQHPERPYSSPRVTVHIDDARSFLARTTARYDRIVYGLIDSHVLLSHGANVRLDSYVFTREGFEQARGHLTDDGALVLSHAVGNPWFIARMRATLAAAFGRPPQLVSELIDHPLGYVYASGPRLRPGPPLSEAQREDVLEDDWPFVYSRAREIPSEYLRALGAMSLLSFSVVAAVMRRARAARVEGPDAEKSASFDWFSFAFGAAFLLLETRGLTALAILVGSTWAVSSAVFAGVLTMALVATAAAQRLGRPEDRRVDNAFFAVLFASLALVYAVPLRSLIALAPWPRAVVGALLVSLPMFASGVLFGRRLEQKGGAHHILAANLLGALVGGSLEYLSMITGFRALLLVAALFYLVALMSFVRGQARALSEAKSG